jgi:hypothetical protein
MLGKNVGDKPIQSHSYHHRPMMPIGAERYKMPLLEDDAFFRGVLPHITEIRAGKPR